MPFSIDIYYLILVLPMMLFALYARFRVKWTFKKYSETDASGGWTGVKVAGKY